VGEQAVVVRLGAAPKTGGVDPAGLTPRLGSERLGGGGGGLTPRLVLSRAQTTSMVPIPRNRTFTVKSLSLSLSLSLQLSLRLVTCQGCDECHSEGVGNVFRWFLALQILRGGFTAAAWQWQTVNAVCGHFRDAPPAPGASGPSSGGWGFTSAAGNPRAERGLVPARESLDWEPAPAACHSLDWHPTGRAQNLPHPGHSVMDMGSYGHGFLKRTSSLARALSPTPARRKSACASTHITHY